MRHKTKIAMFMLSTFFVLSLCATTPVAALGSDSFSVSVGDTHMWEITALIYDVMSLGMELGDRLKVVIKVVNNTDTPMTADQVIADVYNNSVADRTWELSEPNLRLTMYNGSLSPSWMVGFIPIFCPRNTTSVNESFYTMAISIEQPIYSFVVTASGWTATMANGTSTDPTATQLKFSYDTNGILQFLHWDQGSASGWTHIMNLEYYSEGGGIPGFLTFPALLILGLFVAIYVSASKKEL